MLLSLWSQKPDKEENIIIEKSDYISTNIMFSEGYIIKQESSEVMN